MSDGFNLSVHHTPTWGLWLGQSNVSNSNRLIRFCTTDLFLDIFFKYSIKKHILRLLKFLRLIYYEMNFSVFYDNSDKTRMMLFYYIKSLIISAVYI